MIKSIIINADLHLHLLWYFAISTAVARAINPTSNKNMMVSGAAIALPRDDSPWSVNPSSGREQLLCVVVSSKTE